MTQLAVTAVCFGKHSDEALNCNKSVLTQVLTHDGATVKGKSEIMSKLTSIVELHMAFGMSYRAQHIDFTPWLEV